MPDINQTLPLPSSPPPDDNNQDDLESAKTSADPTVDLIRSKVEMLYANEPSALEEEKEIESTGIHSKHQAFMNRLMESGMDLAEVQTEWHNYYLSLPDNEKREVWNEFYSNQAGQPKLAKQMQTAADAKAANRPKDHRARIDNKNQKVIQPLPSAMAVADPPKNHNATAQDIPGDHTAKIESQLLGEAKEPGAIGKSVADTKKELVDKVNARGKLKPKHHIQSLLFGLSMGLIVIFIFMFGFFNERFIAPFITPSRTASSTPIIIDPNAPVGPESKIIIPKINVEVPVVYGTPSIAEDDIQNSLEDGVVHYPTTPTPGENGNVVIVGHSSNNLLNTGKYKFAFVLLNRLQEGDTITMQYKKTRYVYRVYETIIVKPTEVGVLGPTEKDASLSLITCDPPGTSINRLVVRAEQISPSPDKNVASSAPDIEATSVPQVVPGNAPSLFERLFSWL